MTRTVYHIPPKGGWKNNTRYVVEAASSENNPIHTMILEVGLMLEPNDIIHANYTSLYNQGNAIPIKSYKYIKAIREIDSTIPNKYKTLKDLNPMELSLNAKKLYIGFNSSIIKSKDLLSSYIKIEDS